MKMLKPLLLLLVTCTAFPAMSAWQLLNEESNLNFISIKKGNIAEIHQFKQLSAYVENNQVKLIVDLNSVDTKIAIRDQRMRDFLFQTTKFSEATFSAELPNNFLSRMKVGASQKLTLSGEISLHGQTQKVLTKVRVVKLSDGKVVINAIEPVIINAENFALADGVAKLQALAGLPSISRAVPLTFTLTFAL